MMRKAGPSPARCWSISANSRARPTNGRARGRHSGRGAATPRRGDGTATSDRRSRRRAADSKVARSRVVETQGIGEEDHGIPAGRATDASLDIADTPRADAGAFGQFILRQIGGQAEAANDPAEFLGVRHLGIPPPLPPQRHDDLSPARMNGVRYHAPRPICRSTHRSGEAAGNSAAKPVGLSCCRALRSPTLQSV